MRGELWEDQAEAGDARFLHRRKLRGLVRGLVQRKASRSLGIGRCQMKTRDARMSP